MKRLILCLMTLGAAGLTYVAAAQDNPGGPGNTNAPAAAEPQPPPPGGDGPPMPPPEAVAAMAQAVADASGDNGGGTTNTSTVILPARGNAKPHEDILSHFVPPAQATGTNDGALRLNFRNAPLEMVLNYLSDAAGFIIVLDTHVNGTVSVISSHPMTRDEAVDLLNSVLNKNGYAAIRDGRTLTIVDKNDAKTRDIPVKSGNDPLQIPNNDEIVTQIIPIRFVEARQLVSDLTSFVSPQATVVANEAGNAVVITDTQSNIRHLTEIIRAIDDSAEAETEIRVFRLKHASPTDVANELGSIFPNSNSSTGGTQSPIRFGGGGGFFSRMMGMGGGGSSGGSNDRVKKATQVTAVADSRIQAVIVTAPKDLMEQIGSMMTELDVPSTRDQNVYVFHMNNGDPQQALSVLQSMFQTSGSTRGGGSSSSSALQLREQNSATTTSSSSTTSGTLGTPGGGGRTGAQF